MLAHLRDYSLAYLVLGVVLALVAWFAFRAMFAPLPDLERDRDEHEDGGP